VNGVKLPHFLIWCFAGAADRRPPIALSGVPTARIMPPSTGWSYAAKS